MRILPVSPRWRLPRVLTLAVGLVCGLTASLSAATFTVADAQILRDGEPFIIKGTNVNGPGWVWPRNTARDADLIVDTWKFNAVRVNVRLGGGVQNEPLDEIVQAFVSRGIVVLIEVHDFTGRYASDTSTPSLAEVTAWWVARAEQYKDQPLVWFNPYNEPGNRGPAVPQSWLDMHEPVVAAIRATGAQNIIVLDENYWANMSAANSGPTIPDANSAAIQWGEQLQQTYGNLVFAIHMYHEWRDGGPEKVINFHDRLAARGLPMIVGEYGMAAFTPWEAVTSTSHLFEAAKVRDFGRMVWHWDGGDNNRLTTTGIAPGGEQPGGGRFIDRTDGSRPTNLTWLGEIVWDDTHGVTQLALPSHKPVAYDRTGWVATAFGTAPPRQTSLYGGGESVTDPQTPNDVLDGSYSSPGNLSRWLAPVNIADGQWLQIDMLESRPVSRVDVSNQWESWVPGGYKIFISDDPSAWGEPVAVQIDMMGEKRIVFPTVTGRYLRIETTATTAASSTRAWSLREVNVYQESGDTIPPSGPTGLAATGRTATSVTLAWDAASDNVGVAAYEVWVGDSLELTVPGTSATVPGLDAGTVYSFTVRALDEEGNRSEASQPLIVATEAAMAVLTLQAEEGGRRAAQVAADVPGFNGTGYAVLPTTPASVTWSLTVARAGNYAATIRYATVGRASRRAEVSVNHGAGAGVTLAGTGDAAVWQTVTTTLTLQAGPNEVTLASPNAQAAANANSAGLGATGFHLDQITLHHDEVGSDVTPPSAPSGLAASELEQTAFTLTWAEASDNVAVTGYEVFKNDLLVATTNLPHHRLTGLAPGATYIMTVTARDGAGNISAAADALTVTTLAPPPPPALNLEAEEALYSNATVRLQSGVTYLDMGNFVDSWIEWEYVAPSSGTVTLDFVYRNGGTDPRPGTLTINGATAATLPFAGNGDWSPTSWQTQTQLVTLAAGLNRIRIASNNGPDVDYLAVRR